MKKPLLCKFPKCPNVANVRGLCLRIHYQAAVRLIRAGKTTWANLEATGKASPTKGQERRSWFLEGNK